MAMLLEASKLKIGGTNSDDNGSADSEDEVDANLDGDGYGDSEDNADIDSNGFDDI
ncbi:hypothetical protein WN944_007182 [Citrus x changshan-huyou]|uniref:Uncharacterized protein n=1 Tax=Citrus x changshan-huyou TaxID=2935761 RepID=A0AAP0MKI6_9ROSI